MPDQNDLVGLFRKNRRPLRELRQSGLTIRGLARSARELQKAGDWDADEPEMMAVLLVSMNRPRIKAGFDIDRLIDLITQLLPLIVAIMQLFGLFL